MELLLQVLCKFFDMVAYGRPQKRRLLSIFHETFKVLSKITYSCLDNYGRPDRQQSLCHMDYPVNAVFEALTIVVLQYLEFFSGFFCFLLVCCF